MQFPSIVRPLLVASFLIFGTAVRAENVNTKALGPIGKDPTLDSYKVGKQRLKLKAFLVDSADGLNERTIQTAVKRFRSAPGTNGWDWEIGYTSVGHNPLQALVLSWYNLDSKAVGWLAVRAVTDDRWEEMSNRTLSWRPFVQKNLIHRDTVNGELVVTRFSKTGGRKMAYAFSRTAMLVDLEEFAR